jgi:2-hydroxyacyl-CoA lyase 1
MSGIANSWSNCWPLIVISGSYDESEKNHGAFQECFQEKMVEPFVKFSYRVTCPKQLCFALESSFRAALFGRPGVSYIEIPGNVLFLPFQPLKQHVSIPLVPKSVSDPSFIRKAVSLIKNAQKPLIIIGKGAAYARAEESIRLLIENVNIPFIPTPMGKGVVSDLNPHCFSSSRSVAMRNADVILLIGARLNWMLKFGNHFKTYKSIIQFDINAEEMGKMENMLPLLGDISLNISSLNSALKSWKFNNADWIQELEIAKEKNKKLLSVKFEPHPCLNYHTAYKEIVKFITGDTIVVNEGANTMDIGRLMLLNEKPRHRLDAGTFATMGLGVGYSIAAALSFPEKQIVCIQGDSAFGFSAMELETAIRNDLKILFIVINNNGIYGGFSDDEWKNIDIKQRPSTALLPSIRYEMISHAFGGRGNTSVRF